MGGWEMGREKRKREEKEGMKGREEGKREEKRKNKK